MSELPAELIKEIVPGERVIWSGRPHLPRNSRVVLRHVAQTSLAVVLGAVVVMVLWGSPGLGAWIGPIIAIGVLTAGGASLLYVAEASEDGRLSRTSYAVTSSRVLAFESGVGASPRSMRLDGPQDPLRELHGDGTASIWLSYSLEFADDSLRKLGPRIDTEFRFEGLERLRDHQAALEALIGARQGLPDHRGATVGALLVRTGSVT